LANVLRGSLTATYHIHTPYLLRSACWARHRSPPPTTAAITHPHPVCSGPCPPPPQLLRSKPYCWRCILSSSYHADGFFDLAIGP
jgi:hypothetical protein